MRDCLAFTTDGRILSRPKKAEEDGVSITLKKSRQKFLIRDSGFIYTQKTITGTKSLPAYVCHLRSTTTVPFVGREGETGTTPQVHRNLGTEAGTEDGQSYDYVITPEHVYERSESEDMKGLNLASKFPTMMLLLAMGAGGAIFLMIALGLMAAGKLQLG